MKNVNLLAKLFLSFFDNSCSNRLKKNKKENEYKRIKENVSFVKQLVKLLFLPKDWGF